MTKKILGFSGLDGVMEHHTAFGRNVESLDIVIVDDSKTVLTMIRSMITSLKVERVRTFDRGDLALQAIMHEPPNVILTDLAMSPMSGMQLLRLIRQKTMEPLCFIPVIVVTAHATEKRVAQLFEYGAHHVLTKPMSANVLQQRLRSLVADPRVMRLDGERYIIDGMHEVLEEKRSKMRTLEKARLFHEETVPQAKESQRSVDKILKGNVEYDDETGRVVQKASHGMRLGDGLRKEYEKHIKKPEQPTPVRRGRRYAGLSNRHG